MSEVPPNQKNDIELIKNQIIQELYQIILEIVPSLIDDSIIPQKVKASSDIEPDGIIVNGVDLLFLKNKEYIESDPVEGSGYPEFGEVLKTDGQGNYTIKVGCKIVDDDESSEYWEVEYSVVELT
jgi:hypothetical protein